MDLWAFLVELVLRVFCSSALWHIYQTLHLLLRVKECSSQLLCSMQECRFQDAEVIMLS
jgi:hypothetical protein